MFARFMTFQKNESGAATVEFVAVFLGFVAVLMFVIETAVYLFFVGSVEKAAEAGARVAAVSWPVRGDSDLLQPIRLSNNGDYGDSCNRSGGPNACRSYSTVDCGRNTGRNCGRGNNNTRAQQAFNQIVAEMRRYNANITTNNIRISYQDVGIGFAGGPRTPMVTVTVDGMRYNTGLYGLMAGSAGARQWLMPARSASMTGESLGQ